MADSPLGVRFAIDSKDAEAAIARIDSLFGMMSKDVGTVKRELSTLFVGPAGSVGNFGKTVGDSTNSLKEFRQENRTQDYVMRNAQQSVTSLTFAIAFLAQGQEKATTTTRRVTEAIVTGLAAQQATEFAMYGIGRAGEKMGGAFGGALQKIGQYGGAISAVVGITAAAVQIIDALAESVRKSAASLDQLGEKRFAGFVKGASLDSLVAERSAIAGRIQGLTQKKENFGVMDVVRNPSLLVTFITSTQEINQLKEKELALTEEINTQNAKGMTFIGSINMEIEQLVKKRDYEAKSAKEYIALQAKINEKERERNRLLESATETLKRQYGVTLELMESDAASETDPYKREVEQARVRGQKRLMDIELARREGKYSTTDAKKLSDAAMVQVAADIAKAQEEQDKRDLDAAEKRKKKEEEILRLKLDGLSALQQGFSELAGGMSALGIRADSLIMKLVMAAKQIAAIMALLEQNEKMESASGIVGFIGNLFSLGAGLFASQQAPPTSYATPGPTPSRSVVPIVRPNVTVVVRGALSGQKFLRDEMPGYQAFDAQKRVK